MEEYHFSVTEFLDAVNQMLNYDYPAVVIEGEVAEFTISQNKWVFFNLKDETSSLACFIPLFRLRVPLEDGMKVVLRGRPSVTKWGKFSFTVEQIMPVGEGSIKKAYEMLKKKLEKEGLFAPERKRPLPENLVNIGVISSTGAAGYADFCKILSARWGGLKIQTAHTQVQGLDAPSQIIRAMRYFNEKSEVQLIVLIRGGGSKDDLACFNDESLAREIAASKIPVITGIGHEVDESLADLVADLRGSTPSNVAELITPDKRAIQAKIVANLRETRSRLDQEITYLDERLAQSRTNLRQEMKRRLDLLDTSKNLTELRRFMREHLRAREAELGTKKRTVVRFMGEHLRTLENNLATRRQSVARSMNEHLRSLATELEARKKIIARLNPELVLKQGYSIISGKLAPGKLVEITTVNHLAQAEIKAVKERN